MNVREIRKILEEKASDKTKKSWQKFVPSSEKAYGVRVPILNRIAREVKEPDFDLVEKLWKSKVFEEKLLAIKILGRISRRDPDKTLQLVEKFSKDISDWAVCDTLATQGIRNIVKIRQKEIFALSRKYIASKNFWKRRFGLVLLVNFDKDEHFRKEIKEILKKVEGDKEHYVKKAIIWLKNKFNKT